MKNKKELFNKITNLKVEQIKKLGLTEEEVNYIKTKLLNDEIGLKLNFREIDEKHEMNYFILEEQNELGINKKVDKKNNLLIEGDNYHALLALKAASVKVDVIYIDPPYNTGKEFVYNDDFGTEKVVGQDDPHKHSKWLSFMKRRLILAKELLSDEGVIFVSIDDNEQAYLKVLMDEIFGEDNFMGCSLRKTKTNDKPEGNWVRNADYIIGYAKSSNVRIGKTEKRNTKQKYEHEDERGKFLIKHTIDKKDYQGILDFVVEINGRNFYPGGSRDEYNRRQNGNTRIDDFRWSWNKESIEWGIKNNLLSIKGNRIYKKQYENIVYDVKTRKFSDKEENIALINMFEFANNDFTNEKATKTEMGKIFSNKMFDFPKPTSFIKELLKYSSKNITVLDFFAGSGTTGHAVMALNEKDKGDRRFILVTNNERNGYNTETKPEHGIARAITRERMFRVIKGAGTKGEEIKWEYSKDKKSLELNSLVYLKVKEVHKRDGNFEDINSQSETYNREFGRSVDVIDLHNQSSDE